MARIVGLHGIAQQVRGPEVLRAAWAPALRDGVALAGAEPPDQADLQIAFYGDLFRVRGGKAGNGPLYVATDVEEGFERELLSRPIVGPGRECGCGDAAGPAHRSSCSRSNRASRTPASPSSSMTWPACERGRRNPDKAGTKSALAIFTVASVPPFGAGSKRPARRHRAGVMPTQRHHVRVAHGDPGHMLDGHRPGIVS
jgi:hypothetical protein